MLLTFCEHSNYSEWFTGIPLQEENSKLTVYTKKVVDLINQGNGIFDYTESLSYLSYFVHSLPRNMSLSFLFPNSVTYRMDENCRKQYLLVLSKVSLIYNPHSGAKKDKSSSPTHQSNVCSHNKKVNSVIVVKNEFWDIFQINSHSTKDALATKIVSTCSITFSLQKVGRNPGLKFYLPLSNLVFVLL